MRVSTFLRRVDRFLGIPLIYFLGLFHRKKTFKGPCNSIALLCTAAIGDTILISGIIADLKLAYPHAKITFFVGRSNLEAALLIPGIEVREIPVSNPQKAIEIIQREAFDVWIDCGQWARVNALFSFFARAEFKIGFETPGQFRHFVYDHPVLHQTIHEMENYRNLVRALGVDAKLFPRIETGEKGRNEPDRIVLHIFAGGSSPELRHWPEKNWIELIDRLTQKGYSIGLTGGKGDRAVCERLRKGCRNPDQIEIWAGMKTLREISQLLVGAKMVISVNTGIMHLAATLDCLTLALHGPTCPKRWGPIGARTVLIEPPTIKGPLLHLGFEKVPSNMESITVERVWQTLQSFLERKEIP